MWHSAERRREPMCFDVQLVVPVLSGLSTQQRLRDLPEDDVSGRSMCSEVADRLSLHFECRMCGWGDLPLRCLVRARELQLGPGMRRFVQRTLHTLPDCVHRQRVLTGLQHHRRLQPLPEHRVLGANG